MSDVSQGPGWWQASDGKWYPPEQAPGAQPQAPVTPPAGAAPGFGAAPTFGAPGMAGGPTGPGGAPLATWPERVVAFLIEYLPLGIVIGIISQISFSLGLIFQVLWLGWWIYNAMLNGTTGQSIGKKVTGLKVVSIETGEVIGSTNGILRGLFHIVDGIICGIGWLFPLWDAQRQTIADKIAKTVVLSGQQKHEINADLFK